MIVDFSKAERCVPPPPQRKPLKSTPRGSNSVPFPVLVSFLRTPRTTQKASSPSSDVVVTSSAPGPILLLSWAEGTRLFTSTHCSQAPFLQRVLVLILQRHIPRSIKSYNQEEVGKFLGPCQGPEVLVLGSWYLMPSEPEMNGNVASWAPSSQAVFT